ncbi:MAG: hypothetical protein H7258_13810 [Ferruginibacter sp.]|nr:hypothetical protein [Ferruginibacter sp.]
MYLLKDKNFTRFLIKFLLIFAICYYGTLAFIGLAAPGGYYIPFVEHYFNYVSWIRSSLLYGTKVLLSLFSVQTYFASEFNIRMVNGRGIMIVYECVGYGVMSFWIAFIAASEGTFKKKIIWVISGLLIFWLLNICRLSLLLVATNRGWPIPLGWDHHTWFNIVAYIAIFIMMYFFQRTKRPRENLEKASES